jgi:hypothetical protein
MNANPGVPMHAFVDSFWASLEPVAPFVVIVVLLGARGARHEAGRG